MQSEVKFAYARLKHLQFSLWDRLTRMMRQQPSIVALLLPLAMAAFIAWVDSMTGWELSTFVFYGLPIAIAVWWVGGRAGFWMSLICGCVWWIANYESHPYETRLGFFWAVMSRFIFFGVVSYAVTSVRKRQDSDAARIEDLERHRQLEADLVSVSEREQQRIGQDLHDGLCQHLAAIGLATRALVDDLHEKQNQCAQDAELIEQSIQEVINEARGLARGIFPVHVDRYGLVVSLSELAHSTSRLCGLRIYVEERGDVQISSPEVAMHLYRIAQEAVANAVRHGECQNVCIKIESNLEHLILTVTDDGKGFPIHSRLVVGMGHRTMRYRAQIIGATLFMSEPDPHGATLSCVMPLKKS